MNSSWVFLGDRSTSSIIFAVSLLFLQSLQGAEPTITSAPPANGASPSAPFVFTFSEAMNPDASGVDFVDLTTFATLPTAQVWSGGNTILTCTPTPAFPANRQIVWSASGENTAGEPLGEPTGGLFTTGSGSNGGGGSGTRAITTFSVGKVHHYNQISAGSPTLDPGTPYGFSGATFLSSNRTAIKVALTLPTGSVSNLTHLPPPQAEIFLMAPSTANLSAYEATFPEGDYSFFVEAANSNQTVLVNLPTTASLPQPGAPHLTNFPAAQTVNPNQPFVLGWDAFPGGTSADYIFVEIGTNNYSSPNPGFPGALTGADQTFTIPAGTLQPNANYFSRVGFYHHTGATNGSYNVDAYRATFTEFSLITTSSASGPLTLTNAVYASGNFSFDVLCSTGQTVTVEYNTNPAPGVWQTLLTTNSPGSRFRAISPQAATNQFLFFRARDGS
ncbi:MAG TPA: Ig-like domain-containing protein [Verrucomicrobiae bacterium]|nr:Ig-like domain-containing protein [Verrucomicrobiae bacterium]